MNDKRGTILKFFTSSSHQFSKVVRNSRILYCVKLCINLKCKMFSEDNFQDTILFKIKLSTHFQLNGQI